MILSEKSLWVKIYNALCEFTNLLAGASDIDRNKINRWTSRIDICKFARRFLIWTPLTAAFYAGYYTIFLGLIYHLFKNVGFAQVSISIGMGLVYFSAFVGTLMAIVFIGDYIRKKNVDSEGKEPGVVKTWYGAIKSKTCTFMEISE